MVDLSNTDLQLYFHNYNYSIKNKTLRAPRERVLTVKSFMGDKELQVLMKLSYSIFDLKISIVYTYGREIYSFKHTKLFYNCICLKDEQTVTETMVYETGTIFILSLGLVDIEEHRQKVKEKNLMLVILSKRRKTRYFLKYSRNNFLSFQ